MFPFAVASPGAGESDLYVRLREAMVANLQAKGITDKAVLDAMRTVPRHLFVQEKDRPFAYSDYPLPIGEGQTISQPYIVALMTELSSLERNEKVLEIGTGSGYQAAVLSLLSKEVYTIEIIPSLAASAKERLRRLGYGNVSVRLGDGALGWKESAPFDAILITAATERVPDALWQQLREGGRLVAPLGSARRFQRLVRATKRGGKQHLEDLGSVMFVPMTGTAEKEAR